MGGGVKQTNPAQATAANSGATTAANNATNLSNKFSGQQQQLYNNLWGTPATPATPGTPGTPGSTALSNPGAAGLWRMAGGDPNAGRGTPATPGTPGSPGTPGALTGFLDPSKLNVTSPTGPYGLMFTQQKEQLAKGYQDADAATKRNLAQSGFGPGTPSGFAANLSAQNARGLADSTGSAYAGATNNSYQDALANFWKSADLASGGSTAAGQGALAGNNTAAQTYGNLYGTAGHGNVTPGIGGIIGSGLSAGGTMGSAAIGNKGKGK